MKFLVNTTKISSQLYIFSGSAIQIIKESYKVLILNLDIRILLICKIIHILKCTSKYNTHVSFISEKSESKLKTQKCKKYVKMLHRKHWLDINRI